MRLYNISVTTLIIRFNIIMIIIVASGFAAHYIDPAFWFLSVLAFPVLFSVLLGIEFNKRYSIRHPELGRHLTPPVNSHPLTHDH